LANADRFFTTIIGCYRQIQPLSVVVSCIDFAFIYT
jgi:hypothetical protein